MSEEKIEIQDQKLYFKKSLLLYLKEQGLPHSKPTLLKYERLGIIASPRRNIEGFSKNWRIYYGYEIKEIAATLKQKIR